MTVTTVEEQWYRVEATWASVPVHAIQSLLDSRRSLLLLVAGKNYDLVFLSNSSSNSSLVNECECFIAGTKKNT
ncbi:hypothetical protein TNCV_1145631 [Trichonephila clavipes]|nr:hypothetical protein TNCV_1145631 [Trichonephila clavipes]